MSRNPLLLIHETVVSNAENRDEIGNLNYKNQPHKQHIWFFPNTKSQRKKTKELFFPNAQKMYIENE